MATMAPTTTATALPCRPCGSLSCWPMIGNWLERRVEDPLLQVGVVLQHEAEHRGQQQQQGEQRQEPVVRDQGGQVGTLVLGELVDRRRSGTPSTGCRRWKRSSPSSPRIPGLLATSRPPSRTLCRLARRPPCAMSSAADPAVTTAVTTLIDLEPAARRLADLVAAVTDDQLAGPPCARRTRSGDLVDHVDGLSQAFTAAATKDVGDAAPQGPSGDASRLTPDFRRAHPRPARRARRGLARPAGVDGDDPGRRRRPARRGRRAGGAQRAGRPRLGHRHGERAALRPDDASLAGRRRASWPSSRDRATRRPAAGLFGPEVPCPPTRRCSTA